MAALRGMLATLRDANGDTAFRTSETCDLPMDEADVAALDARFSALSGIDRPFGEPIQGQRYDVGQEFKAHNRSQPWAEAYYAERVCHAYLDPTKPNPYHWLLHEAVHQLNREYAGIAKERPTMMKQYAMSPAVIQESLRTAF